MAVNAIREVELHKRQSVAFDSYATEILYGGAAGGGKSFFLRASAIRWCLEVPGIQVYIFRRTSPDLKANHLRGPSSFFVMLGELLDSKHVVYKAQDNEFVFDSGSRIALCYAQYETDVHKFQGAEIHVLMMDELTTFTSYQYTFLRGRVRMAGLQVPARYRGRLPRIECGSNPGYIGHAWVKRTFVTPKAPEVIWRTPSTEGGMKRQYIPAKLKDNPTLMDEDPMYMQRLEGLANPALVAAMRDGDWDIIAGAAFDKWKYDRHVIPKLQIPAHWNRVCSMDWGSSKPFSVGWWAVSPGEEIGPASESRYIPRGALVRYAEWYGWNGEPDQGCRMESVDVALGIKEREAVLGHIGYRVLDVAAFARHDGPSIAERMEGQGVRFARSKKDRAQMYEELRYRLVGEDGLPMIYIMNHCEHFIRTIPDLVLDEKSGFDDVDSSQEDHCFSSDTRILTDQGYKSIGELVGTTGRVMSVGGWQPYHSVRKTRTAETVTVVFDDDHQVTCTPDHKFLTPGGWKKAEDLLDEKCYTYHTFQSGELSWLRSFPLPFRSSRVLGIICAVRTFSIKVFACIVCSGKVSTGVSRLDTMFTMLMETARITGLKTSVVSRAAIIWPTMGETMTGKPGNRRCAKAQKRGMAARKVRPGIKRSTSNIVPGRSIAGLRRCASNVKRSFRAWLRAFFVPDVARLQLAGHPGSMISGDSVNGAETNSPPTSTPKNVSVPTRARVISVKPAGKCEVYCLGVEGTHSFALENGVIVHNCYDETGYVLLSMPYVSDRPVAAPQLEEVLKAATAVPTYDELIKRQQPAQRERF